MISSCLFGSWASSFRYIIDVQLFFFLNFKSYDKELRNVKKKVKDLEDKNELLKMELDSR